MLLAAMVARARCERAVHRGVARLEQLGHLGGVPPHDVAQQQHRALTRREVLQRGDEREADGLARLGQLGGVAIDRQHARVGDGQHPLRLGEHRRGRRVGGRRAAEVHRAGAPVAAVEHVEAHVGGDAVEPRPQLRPALEAVVGAPGAHHGLLHGVLGLERRAEHPVAVCGELPAVPLQDLVEPGFGHLGHVRRVLLGHGHVMRTARTPRTHRFGPGPRARARCSPDARSTRRGPRSPRRRSGGRVRRS